MDEMKKAILKSMKSTDQVTATGIAKKLGKKKASTKMKEAINELANENLLVKSEIGRFITYSKKAKGVSLSGAKADDKIISSSKVEKLLTKLKPGELEDVPIPSGMIVSDGKSGSKSYTLPDGKTYKLKADESLVIINGVVQCKTKTSEAAEKYMRYWCQKNSMDSADVTVKEATTKESVFSVGKGLQLNKQRLLNWSVSKNNKAA